MESIDISSQKQIKFWSKKLGCKEADLLDAVLKVGNNSKIVDTFLQLNRKK